jgi:hypothetical protein
MPRPLIRRCAVVLLLGSAALPTFVSGRAVAQRVVREQRTVAIDGAKETWQLVWDGKPGSVCGPDNIDLAMTCPCSGWAYGEYGKLLLVRSRDGQEIERMDLRPLFDKFDSPEPGKVAGSAYLQRWPLKLSDMGG